MPLGVRNPGALPNVLARVEGLRASLGDKDLDEGVRIAIDGILRFAQTQHELNKRLWESKKGNTEHHAETHKGADDNLSGLIIPSTIEVGDVGSIGSAYLGYAPINHEHPVTIVSPGILVPRGGTVLAPTLPQNVTVWYAPYDCEVIAVHAFQTGGTTGTTVNARINGTSNHLATDITISALGAWISSTTVQNTTYAVGDYLQLMITSIPAPLPAEIAIQVDFQRT
jgi:hypothetical protein